MVIGEGRTDNSVVFTGAFDFLAALQSCVLVVDRLTGQ